MTSGKSVLERIKEKNQPVDVIGRADHQVLGEEKSRRQRDDGEALRYSSPRNSVFLYNNCQGNSFSICVGGNKFPTKHRSL